MAVDRSQYGILLVEDTLEMAQLTLLTLKRAGFVAYHVKDGDEAIEFLHQYRPDLVLLDLNLPGKSGWQVLDFLVERHGKTVPVIVTTAMGDSANRVIGKLQDVVRYLVKPFPPDDLAEAVEEALGIAPS